MIFKTTLMRRENDPEKQVLISRQLKSLGESARDPCWWVKEVVPWMHSLIQLFMGKEAELLITWCVVLDLRRTGVNM